MSTKNNPGVFDCYANAEPDEPMFVLLGRDKHAPTLVWLWATLRELDGEDESKTTEARLCAAEMLRWAHDHGKSAVGFGQATLAGVMELIRSVNTLIKHAGQAVNNKGTDVEVMRQFLAATVFEVDEGKS